MRRRAPPRAGCREPASQCPARSGQFRSIERSGQAARGGGRVPALDARRPELPRGRFIEVDYEALIADREAVTRQLIAFAGLDWHDACISPERNERMVMTASLWQGGQA